MFQLYVTPGMTSQTDTAKENITAQFPAFPS